MTTDLMQLRKQLHDYRHYLKDHIAPCAIVPPDYTPHTYERDISECIGLRVPDPAIVQRASDMISAITESAVSMRSTIAEELWKLRDFHKDFENAIAMTYDGWDG